MSADSDCYLKHYLVTLKTVSAFTIIHFRYTLISLLFLFTIWLSFLFVFVFSWGGGGEGRVWGILGMVAGSMHEVSEFGGTVSVWSLPHVIASKVRVVMCGFCRVYGYHMVMTMVIVILYLLMCTDASDSISAFFHCSILLGLNHGLNDQNQW